MVVAPLSPPSTPSATPVPTSSTSRVSLAPGGSGSGPLDGAWWPHSRQLDSELALLAAEFEMRLGRITRAAVNPTHWPLVPRRLEVLGRALHVGRFSARQDPHTLLLLAGRVRRWDLLVIPPETPPALAARLMAAACDPDGVLGAAALLDRTTAAFDAAQKAEEKSADRAGEADWEAEGGRGPQRTLATVTGS